MEVEGLVSLEGEDDGADGVGVGLDWGGGEGGGPSRLRLENEGKSVIDERPKSPIEKSKRNLKFYSPVLREREIFPSIQFVKEWI